MCLVTYLWINFTFFICTFVFLERNKNKEIIARLKYGNEAEEAKKFWQEEDKKQDKEDKDKKVQNRRKNTRDNEPPTKLWRNKGRNKKLRRGIKIKQ